MNHENIQKNLEKFLAACITISTDSMVSGGIDGNADLVCIFYDLAAHSRS